MCFFFFFFNDTATTEIYTLSLHDALPIWRTLGKLSFEERRAYEVAPGRRPGFRAIFGMGTQNAHRSEEHTSELQSQSNLVCRLLLEKKKKKQNNRVPMYITEPHHSSCALT